MRLVMFSHNGSAPRMGAMTRTGIVDFMPIGVPDDMVSFAALADVLLPEAGDFIVDAEKIPTTDVILHAPVTRPPKNIFCVDLNHMAAVGEFATSGFDVVAERSAPGDLVVSSKPATSIIGPDEPIDLSVTPADHVDYEGELAVVVGEGGSKIPLNEAKRHLFGYTIVNDVTSRSAQRDHQQWMLAKGSDTFCPLGPAVVTADELPDIGTLWVRSRVNGELRQEYRLDSLIYGVEEIVTRLSMSVMLEPGDIIACGTGPGTGLASRPPVFLATGDVVAVEVDGIGVLSNPVA